MYLLTSQGRIDHVTSLRLDHGIALAAVKSGELIQHLLLLCIAKVLGGSIRAWCWLLLFFLLLLLVRVNFSRLRMQKSIVVI